MRNAVIALFAVAVALFAASALAQSKARPAAFDASACLACHAPIKAFYDGGKHKTVGLQRLPRRHGGPPVGHEEAPGHEDRPRHLRRLPPEPVQVVRADGLAPHGALREEAVHRACARSLVRPSDDAARLHQGAQPAARAHLRAARPVRGRPRLRRPLRAEGHVALPRGHRATSRCGTSPSTCIPTTATRSRSSREPRPRRIPCACRARRRTTSSTGRSWATRCRRRSGAARPRWSRRRVR